MSTGIFAALLVGGGLFLLVVGVLFGVEQRHQELRRLLDLPYGERDVPVDAVTETGSLFTLGRTGDLIGRLDTRDRLALTLERARIPLRPGEYLAASLLGALVLGAAFLALGGAWVFGVLGAGLAALAAAAIPGQRITRRRQLLEAQLPDALSLIASSLSGGHTFLRAVQMMSEQADAPLAEELSQVLAETQLGRPLLDCLERMAVRLEIRDLTWVVQAVRIQQTVGGRLADLLHTLADFIRAREELRREVKVLTAEGRLSAFILGALPVFILVAVQIVDPGYLKPLYHGWGYAWLAGSAASAVIGITMIFSMVKIDV